MAWVLWIINLLIWLALFAGVIALARWINENRHRVECQACRQRIDDRATICRFCHTPVGP